MGLLVLNQAIWPLVRDFSGAGTLYGIFISSVFYTLANDTNEAMHSISSGGCYQRCNLQDGTTKYLPLNWNWNFSVQAMEPLSKLLFLWLLLIIIDATAILHRSMWNILEKWNSCGLMYLLVFFGFSTRFWNEVCWVTLKQRIWGIGFDVCSPIIF